MDGNHAAGAGPTLSTIDGVGDIALSIATYLPTARDKLSLLQVNRGWRDVISSNDILLFHNHLKEDFVEGVVLMCVAEMHGVSRRKLYLAFRRRWSLPKEGGEQVHMCIPWQRPHAQTSDDVSSLIFIGRVGKDDNPETCALMEWIERDYSSGHQGVLLGYQKLEVGSLLGDDVPEEDWEALEEEYGYGGFDVPHNERLMDLLDEEDRDDDWHREFCEEMNKTHGISLHVIDLHNFRAMTLMEDDPMSMEETDIEEHLTPYLETKGHGSHMPKLLGRGKEGQIEQISIGGSLCLYIDVASNVHYRFNAGDGLEFSFGRLANATISQRSDICNYLRTLMKEKCGTWHAPLESS